MTQQQTLFDTGEKNTAEVARLEERRRSKPEMPTPPKQGPTKSKRYEDCMTILNILRNCDSVSSRLLREKLPHSMTQRMSDLRGDGYVIDCYQPTGSACGLYTLKNPAHRGKKYH